MSNFLKKISINNETISIITLYGDNRNQEVTEWHKKVMVDHFGLPVNYIKCPFPGVSHGGFMNLLLKETIDSDDSPDYYYWLDNDCIQLRSEALFLLYNTICNKITIFGHAWQSNHKVGPNGQIPHAYASQACLGFSKKIYNELGRPDMDHFFQRSDTSEELTYFAKEKGYNVSLIYPSHSIIADTPLDNGMKYGMGNTYGPLTMPLWHHTSCAGNPRHSEVFIETCKKVIKNEFQQQNPSLPYV